MIRFTLISGALFLLLPFCAWAQTVKPAAGRYFVAVNGNDHWSGKLPAPNKAQTDGPFATLGRARDALRGKTGLKQVYVRAGSYYLPEPLQLTPADSGISFLAYPGERPLLSGGRPITGWHKADGPLWAADIPAVKAGKWRFSQLFAGEEPQICARTPNFDPKNPYKGGWAHIVYTAKGKGAFGAAMGRIHTPGDWIEWKVNVPAGGEYALWFYYGAENKPFGNDNMGGRTTMQVDGGQPVTLQNLPDTGSFSTFQWNKTATLSLTPGTHTLRWTNVKGGGLEFDAFALCDDPAWKPAGTELAAPAGKNLLVVQAEAYAAAQGKEITAPDESTPAYKTHFEYREGDLQPFPRSPEPEIHIFPAWGWVNTILHVTKIDPETHTVTVAEDGNAGEELRVGNRYYVSNVFEALDTPGEWYLDRAAGTLYYWPKREDFQHLGMAAPVLDRVINLVGDPAKDQWVENVTIKGFQISHTTYARELPSVYSPQDAAIWLAGARRCVIEGNRLINVGGYGVRLEERSANNEIVGNEIGLAGEGGVVLVGDVDTQPLDNLVAGNWIHHCGQVYKHVAGVYSITASGTRIAHNRIEYMPRYAVSLKSHDARNYSHRNTVEYNDMLYTNLETNDTGAVETLGRHKQDTGNVIQYNRIIDVVGLKAMPDGSLRSPYFTWGIYLDDYSSGTTVRGNLVVRFDWGGGCIHGGKNNVFENNIFVDGMSHQMRYQVRDDFCRDNRFTHNILVYRDANADLLKHTGTWSQAVLAESDNNLFWHEGGEEFFKDHGSTPLGTLAQWRAGGFDQHSLVADPLFVNPAKDDYRLRPDSPAFKLGIQQLPWEKIGLQGYARAWRMKQ